MEQYSSAIDASNAFQSHFFRTNLLDREKASVTKNLKTKARKLKSYLQKIESKTAELTNRQYNQLADVIMANLGQIAPNQSQVELFNFYSNESCTIKLNPRLSAQKNAERYYQKSKNQNIELAKLQENIERKKKELQSLENDLEELDSISNLKLLRKRFPVKSASGNTDSQQENLPYNKFEIDGFDVLVGKNAKHNDRLTLNYAHKDDLWFHAKDVAGSHVVLKMIPGKSFPSPVIEKTAQLAAWYSKGKNFPLCPVIYTPKKYVRKPKGFAPGMVKVEREEIVLVEPQRTHVSN